MGLVGPNGAGKSTLARMILGFTKPDSGTISIDDLAPRVFRETRGVGYLPEETDRLFAFSGRELLATRFPDFAGSPVVNALRIDDWLDKRMSSLSKGQWRRMLMAYAMIGDPEIVVLDEPDSGLDPLALDAFQAAVRVTAERGAAVIMLSHNLDEIRRACLRIGFVFNGRLAALENIEGLTTEEVRQLYRQSAEGSAVHEDA